MKKLLMLLTAGILVNVLPVSAQSTGIVDAVIADFNLRELGIRLLINIVAVFILVHLIYYSRHKNKDFQFTLILFNCVNFLICYLLSGANLEVGFAFGLFAIFSIMRYRTVTVPIREMGYLFICVALGLINSLATTQDSYIILISANAFIILLPLFMDRSGSKLTVTAPGMTRDIIYERIDLIKPERQNEMIEDLRNRTGLSVYKVDIVSIDLMQDIAVVKAHYNEESMVSPETTVYYGKERGNVIQLEAQHA